MIKALMFLIRNIQFLVHIFGGTEWLRVGDRKMQVRAVMLNISPALLTKIYGTTEERAANREELELFAEEYRPIFPVYAVEEESQSTIFGPFSILYVANFGKVEQAEQNLVWGLPRRSLVLWVKKN